MPASPTCSSSSAPSLGRHGCEGARRGKGARRRDRPLRPRAGRCRGRACSVANSRPLDPGRGFRRLAGQRNSHRDRGTGRRAGLRPAAGATAADLVRSTAAGSRRLPARPRPRGFSGRWFAAYHSRGARILVEGIETVRELRVAVDCGADCCAASCLRRRPLPAPSSRNEPLPIEGFLSERRVVPLVPLMPGIAAIITAVDRSTKTNDWKQRVVSP